MSRLIAACVVLLSALALADGALVGTPSVVYVGPGQQSDPHVSGDFVAYTSLVQGASQIRYHDLATGTDKGIPNGGHFDFLSGIDRNTIVFTRVSETNEAIYRFDVATNGPAVEIAPDAESRRRAAAIGLDTVAWQDFGFGTSSEIVIADLTTSSVTRLTNDSRTDRAVAVAPDGQAVTWVKCATETTGCNVWKALRSDATWTSSEITTSESEESLPDVNDKFIVYASARTIGGVLERDIYWQSVLGGAEMRLALPGVDSNPNIAQHLIAFERRDPATPSNADIVVYDMNTDTLYRVTETPQNESLNDISYTDEGVIRVVWTRSDDGDQNVYAFSFTLTSGTVCDTDAETTCENPGSRPLLGTLEITRGTGAPQTAQLSVASVPGDGLLCVRSEETSAGWVHIDGSEVMGPQNFKRDVTTYTARGPLTAASTVSARIAGKKGSHFAVDVYGPSVCTATSYMASRVGTPGGGIQTIAGKSTGRSEVIESFGSGTAFGCNATGSSGFAAVLALIALACLFESRRVRVPVRRDRRSRR